MTAQPHDAERRRRPSPVPAPSRGGIYLGVIGLLLAMVVALVGGIIWYNSTKTNELVMASAERLILETDEKVRDRLKLLYDPMYAIVSLASQSPPLHSPSVKNDERTKTLFLRALRVYPQVLSLYVGFDNGEFFEVIHVAGDANKPLRARLGAPEDAVFANEFVDLETDGRLKTRWEFLAEDGSIVGKRDTAPDYDPRTRPWYKDAKQNDEVVRSDLYVFASSGDPGFTLSRRFTGTPDG